MRISGDIFDREAWKLTEPVDSVDDALKDSQERIDNPILESC